ncbi:hypothetical protein cypCar_00017310 [Cyprinus carpio]|nr:hypothetical protein cypCar_00017310 [Cyprinus carpio]
MWCVPHPNKKGHTLVLLDTEGLGDVEKGDEKHDTWIFCLAVLLSSTLVYNSLGVIDNTALEKLHAECSYVTELTENIRVKAKVGQHEEESADFMRVFPSFVWAVRDFTLELKRGDKLITSDEYLEGALKPKTGSSPQTAQFNLPRNCLRQFFAVRKCFVFPRPASTQNMRRMEQLTEEELESEFLEQANNFCCYVYNNAEPKTVTGGCTLTGTGGKIHNEYQDMCQQNHDASRMQCEEVLREVFDKLEKNISNGSYLKPGGYQQYRDTLRHLTNDYRARTHSQIMSEEVLSTYLRAKEQAGKTILQADQSLSAAEQENEVQRLKNEIMKQRQKGLEEQNQLQEQAFKDMQRTHDEHVKQIIHQMEREQERISRDNERVLEAKLKEREALLQQGFQQEAARMQREIDSLKSDMNKQETSQRSTMSTVLDGIGTAATFLLPGFVPKLAGVGLSLISKLF